jgi:hypothetical protein
MKNKGLLICLFWVFLTQFNASAKAISTPIYLGGTPQYKMVFLIKNQLKIVLY